MSSFWWLCWVSSNQHKSKEIPSFFPQEQQGLSMNSWMVLWLLILNMSSTILLTSSRKANSACLGGCLMGLWSCLNSVSDPVSSRQFCGMESKHICILKNRCFQLLPFLFGKTIFVNVKCFQQLEISVFTDGSALDGCNTTGGIYGHLVPLLI